MPSLARPPRTGLKRAASAAPRASADAAPALPAGADPLHLRLRNHLRDEILQGRLAPLAQLPSEAELIARFEVSRITVRHALAALHAEGLITKVQGKGSFVAPPRLSPPQDRLRGLSESLGDAGHEVQARLVGGGEAAATPALARRLGMAAGTPVAELLSLRYVDRQPLSLNRLLMAAPLAARLRKADIGRRDVVAIYETDFGLHVGHAEVEISATAAGRLQRKHLGLPEQAPVLQVERLVHDAAGAPLHLETSWYRPEGFSYKLRLER
ncbi:GntR family transcriptional regulator [Aquincola tertiaricarbonis]|uniref:GntR family transcriptional regulator n=1 Tax=Aquincola tertiaricarbonis TaxID=391953 RepID=UPI000697F1F8|nr:GntR family transcriptional regulator [Aquincola tertiaricarbonis]